MVSPHWPEVRGVGVFMVSPHWPEVRGVGVFMVAHTGQR